MANQRSRENRAPRETDCGTIGSAEPFGPWRRPMSTSVFWTETMIELPEVIEDGMSGRNVQRKPGTARGSPRRSRTAKASRISRHAVKSRCAREWDGWGRLSEDGPEQNNPDRSEGPWGRAALPPLARRCSGAQRLRHRTEIRGLQAASTKGGRKPCGVTRGRRGGRPRLTSRP